ncbi:MAG: sugar ABC transporter permease [Alkalispirochaeta sp.]|jgi:multiple sugar transport system permease protein
MGRKQYKGLAEREARLAILMLIPAFLIVFAIILFPVLLNFWISFKEVQLGDLRAPAPVAREQIVQRPRRAGDALILEYQLRNTSRQDPIENVRVTGTVPPGLKAAELPEPFRLEDRKLVARYDRWEPAFSQRVQLVFTADASFVDGPWLQSADMTFPAADGRSANRLFNFTFTGKNYRQVLSSTSFWPALATSFIYTTGGAIGAILLGLLAAQLLNTRFHGKSLMRGLLLFPYVAPVIAVAFTWSFLLDPFSGTFNALLVRFGVVSEGISFLSERTAAVSLFGFSFRIPLALSTVIAFDAWRYFPFSFLFILARLQAIPDALYESAEVDGATPYQKFFRITVPQLSGVLGTLFLLRFMWTFNKFDDVFLLTGGAAGTQTLPIQVYDYAFGRADIGAGAATAVMLFLFLAVFLIIYFRYTPEEEA